MVILVNASDKSEAYEDITYKIIRKLFGIADSVLPNASVYFRSATGPLPPITHQVPELQRSAAAIAPPHDFTGAYHNKGYGSIVLCNATSTSHYCNRVLDDFRTVDRAMERHAEAQELYGEWPRFRSTHVRLVHADGLRFNLLTPTLYTQGYGRNTTPFEDNGFGSSPIEFLVEAGEVVGFGLTGTVLEGKTMWQKKGGSIRDTADAWFAKV